MNSIILNKYNVPAPRYTSYPTIPFWNNNIDVDKWEVNFQEQFRKENKEGLSVYIHLPFCESLCTYCGCNKKITTNHNVEERYVKAIIKEWDMYLDMMNSTPLIREIHLGGGTPTFFSALNLENLVNGILKKCNIHHNANFSIEAHPNNTTKLQLETLFNLGFRRISFGVQDTNQDVQKMINRIQPLENVKKATLLARKIGFNSVNFDLIYGLPLQTIKSISQTIQETIALQPDRIAFYSYAHTPWKSRGQRLFTEADLPEAKLKLELYLIGKKLLVESGYHDIGMDHFALEKDELFVASKKGKLFRNFMGYTVQNTNMTLGLGVSAISDVGNAFAQNKKALHEYYASIELQELPVQKGFFLDGNDLIFRKHIQDIMCTGKTWLTNTNLEILLDYTFPKLKQLEYDGLIKWEGNLVKVTRLGRSFLRNICMAFDIYLLKSQEAKMFSLAI